MNQSNGVAVLLSYLAKKRYEQLCLFRRKFDIIKDDLSNTVYAGKKMRAIAFAGAIYVQYVSASKFHHFF